MFPEFFGPNKIFGQTCMTEQSEVACICTLLAKHHSTEVNWHECGHCSRGHITIGEIGTSVSFVMKYFKHYTEWALSHPVLSRLGKMFKNEMSQKSGKILKGGGAP